MIDTQRRYRGTLYRALNPIYARTPLSGLGADRYGGRFNPQGVAALYTSLDPATALKEANQVGALQPTILVSYDANLGPIFDTRDQAVMHTKAASTDMLADTGWRHKILNGDKVPTQEFAQALIADGFVGMLVRSFAKATTQDNLNIVLWRWTGADIDLRLIDNENRLSRL